MLGYIHRIYTVDRGDIVTMLGVSLWPSMKPNAPLFIVQIVLYRIEANKYQLERVQN